jgi:hypothetical protein
MSNKRRSRQPYRTELSINDIRGLAWNASNNDQFAYDVLKEQNRKLAKIANSRLRALEAAGYDMFVYDSTITYLSNNGLRRFSTVLPKATDYKAIVKQMEHLVNFINAKSSTVAGAREALEKKMETVSNFTGHTYTEEQKNRLGHLMSNDSVSTLLRDIRGDSGEVIEVLEEISMKDVNTSQLESIIDKYLQGYNPFTDNPFFSNLDYLNYDEMMNEIRTAYGLKKEEKEKEDD